MATAPTTAKAAKGAKTTPWAAALEKGVEGWSSFTETGSGEDNRTEDGSREVVDSARVRAGLDAAALDISPRSDGDVSAQYSDDDDDDRSVAFEPLVKKLLGTTSTKKKSAPHLRAVASRIAGALVEDRDGDYDEGHAGKARQGFLTRHLYDALEKEERRKGQGVAWDVLKKELERRGVIRALSSRDLELQIGRAHV